jgi:hypothetical protein
MIMANKFILIIHFVLIAHLLNSFQRNTFTTGGPTLAEEGGPLSPFVGETSKITPHMHHWWTGDITVEFRFFWRGRFGCDRPKRGQFFLEKTKRNRGFFFESGDISKGVLETVPYRHGW